MKKFFSLSLNKSQPEEHEIKTRIKMTQRLSISYPQVELCAVVVV